MALGRSGSVRGIAYLWFFQLSLPLFAWMQNVPYYPTVRVNLWVLPFNRRQNRSGYSSPTIIQSFEKD